MILEWLQALDGQKVLSWALDVLGALLGLAALCALGLAVARLYFVAVWHLRQRGWRRNPKVGDRAFFYNAGGGITAGEVKAVSENKLKVWLYSTHSSNLSNWHDTKHLFHLTKEEEDYINAKNLQATLKRLKGIK